MQVLVVDHQQLEPGAEAARERQGRIERGLRLCTGIHEYEDVAKGVHGDLPWAGDSGPSSPQA